MRGLQLDALNVKCVCLYALFVFVCARVSFYVDEAHSFMRAVLFPVFTGLLLMSPNKLVLYLNRIQ